MQLGPLSASTPLLHQQQTDSSGLQSLYIYQLKPALGCGAYSVIGNQQPNIIGPSRLALLLLYTTRALQPQALSI